MRDRAFWKVLFVIILLANALSIYESFTLPSSLKPVHPTWFSYVGLVVDIVNLYAAFAVAFRSQLIKHVWFWRIALIGIVSSNIAMFYWEFSSGGYSVTDMIAQGLIALPLLMLFIFPVLQCVADIRKSDPVSNIH
ncbi:hypothetical protein [Thalassotalea euphylliae]|nr:hypothetical protein [Thalassotalea euphylliae]